MREVRGIRKNTFVRLKDSTAGGDAIPSALHARKLTRPEARRCPGQQKGAKFPTSKAPISAAFHSFRLILGRAIIFRNGLEAWALFPERARAEHSR